MKKVTYNTYAYERLSEIISTTFQIPRERVTPELRQEDVERWDSFQHLTLTMEIEAAFNITFQTEDVPEMRDVEGIMRVLRMRGVDI
ncbi:MAG: acyl carrier protein [Nitrospirae bacterium]|nr:acyl carrier protein [Nitrospirota bacterium]